MLSEVMKENIKRHYGDTDDDLKDLAEIMDALNDLDKLEDLKRDLETSKLEAEKQLKELDTSWRTRYRERFFDGDVSVPDFVDEGSDEDEQPEDISIEEYIAEIEKEKK